MLPDFPAAKNRLKKFWDQYADLQRQKFLGYFADIPSHKHYEGNSWVTNREDQTSSESNYKEIGSSFQMHIDEIPDLNPAKIAQKLDQVAKEMAGQMEKHLFETIMQEMQAAGRIHNSSEQEITQEIFLQAIESISISFDKNGKPNLPTIFVSPELGEKLQPKLKDWDEDEEMKNKFDQIIDRKREEWYARESRRKLVD